MKMSLLLNHFINCGFLFFAKKNKSMQPKDFEEELANSAEKMERKRKRLEKKEKWKVLETPVTPHQYNRGQFYVAETQSMSPVSVEHSEKCDELNKFILFLKYKLSLAHDVTSPENMYMYYQVLMHCWP